MKQLIKIFLITFTTLFIGCKKDESTEPIIDLTEINTDWKQNDGDQKYRFEFPSEVKEVISDYPYDVKNQELGRLTHWFKESIPAVGIDYTIKEWGEFTAYQIYEKTYETTVGVKIPVLIIEGIVDYKEKKTEILGVEGDLPNFISGPGGPTHVKITLYLGENSALINSRMFNSN